MASRSSTKEKKNSKRHKYEPLSDSRDDFGSSADTAKKAKTVSVSATFTTISLNARHQKKLKLKLKKKMSKASEKKSKKSKKKIKKEV